ncbi:unnamed protein product [Psylliodes chrysocephalus]|uniref:Fatty acyl-CoA reductase n=1 Tax=Psylliodes chrysocephalus TaxID=3402493 RepID=A0A9P0D8W1_9CUCU|nr:unnamed protein product [Psylliodes chrysocephala]
MWENIDSKISIPEFYENKNVFITGATGYLGKLLVEKLLRSCSGIRNIYVLIRAKHGKSPQDRMSDVTNDPLFDTIRKENSAALNKIIPIIGDIEKVNFGLSEKDKATIIENVTIIFHCAASIRFDDPIKKAVFANTRSAREITLLARQLKRIDVFVHLSTAYSNCDNLIVEEKLYPAKMNWRDLIRLAEEYDETTLQYLVHKLIYPMPNTYVFTKALAEHAVVDLAKDKIPAVIMRPTVVFSTYSDPVPGWLDNINGTAGVFYGLGKGVVRSIWVDINVKLDHVFADSVTKALIIASWKKALSGNTDEVYLCNLASDIRIHFGDMHEMGKVYIQNSPSVSYLWPPETNGTSNNYYVFYFFVLLRQLLPAIFIDTLLILSKRQPMLWKVNRKIFIAMSCLAPFMRNTWIFKNENYMELIKSILQQDSKEFSIVNFGPNASRKIHDECLVMFSDGIRKYYAKEPPATEAMVKKQAMLVLVEKLCKIILLGLVIYYVFCEKRLISVLSGKVYTYFENLDA